MKIDTNIVRKKENVYCIQTRFDYKNVFLERTLARWGAYEKLVFTKKRVHKKENQMLVILYILLSRKFCSLK